jgi:TrmH family RNA methyltransferase
MKMPVIITSNILDLYSSKYVMQEVSKAKLKQYQQLHSKKFRQKYGLFIVEGVKSVNELDQSDWPVECILCTPSFFQEHSGAFNNDTFELDEVEFNKTSQLKNPQQVLAIAKLQSPETKKSNWTIALDNINDPGNLGTIIRTADWYGITEILCSKNCVDAFNPKVIQASMGSFLRIAVKEADLATELEGKTVFATLLDGQNIQEVNDSTGVILIGNEANGISQDLLKSIDYKAITIPRKGKAESLNAAIATAVCCERLVG